MSTPPVLVKKQTRLLVTSNKVKNIDLKTIKLMVCVLKATIVHIVTLLQVVNLDILDPAIIILTH